MKMELVSANGRIEFDFLEFEDASGDCKVKLTVEVELAPRSGGLSVTGWTEIWLDQEMLDKFASDLAVLAGNSHGLAVLTSVGPDEFSLTLNSGGQAESVTGQFEFGKGGYVSREPFEPGEPYYKDTTNFSGSLEISKSAVKTLADDLTTYVVPGGKAS